MDAAGARGRRTVKYERRKEGEKRRKGERRDEDETPDIFTQQEETLA